MSVGFRAHPVSSLRTETAPPKRRELPRKHIVTGWRASKLLWERTFRRNFPFDERSIQRCFLFDEIISWTLTFIVGHARFRLQTQCFGLFENKPVLERRTGAVDCPAMNIVLKPYDAASDNDKLDENNDELMRQRWVEDSMKRKLSSLTLSFGWIYMYVYNTGEIVMITCRFWYTVWASCYVPFERNIQRNNTMRRSV